MTEEIKDIQIEDLIAETEQKILDNKYYEDTTVIYKNARVHVRIQPISQAKFKRITRNKEDLEKADIYSKICKECVINKHNDEKFTPSQIEDIFTGGLAMAVGLKCLEVSGIDFEQKQFR